MCVPEDQPERHVLLLPNKKVKHKDIYNTPPNSQKLNKLKRLSVVKWAKCRVFMLQTATQQWKGT